MTNQGKPVFEYHVAPPEKQNRWGVLLRIFLVIPYALFAGFMVYAAALLTFFAWFCMIFTGRNPYHDFNSKALRAYQRYSGYSLLLTSKYPAFSLEEDPDYAITSQLEKGPLVRMKVLFRLILMIPVLLVDWIVSYGLILIVIFSWFTLLIRGKLPKTLHDTIAASIRFQGRVTGYVLLLQDPYPRGLFGDKITTPDGDDVLEIDHEEVEPTISPTPVSESSSDGLENSDEFSTSLSAMPPPHVADVELADSQGQSDAARSWLMVLSAGTKRLLVVVLVLGTVAVSLYVIYRPHWKYQTAIVSNVSTSTWKSEYRIDVVNIRNDVLGYQSVFDAKHPNWSTVTKDCVALQNQYNVFDTVPYYPQAGPDQYLLSGLRAIYAGMNGCITIIAPYKVLKAMPYLSTQFATGTADLKTFLDQT